MNSFLSQEEIAKIGLKSYGQNVYISRHASIYSPEKIAIGDNVRIDDFCILSGIIEIGSCVHIAAYSAIYGGDKGVFISDYANISSRVSVYSVSDDYSVYFRAEGARKFMCVFRRKNTSVHCAGKYYYIPLVLAALDG